MAEKSLGYIVKEERRKRDWTVKEFINRIESKLNEKVSPAYITRIEQYGEIPRPELLCAIADILGRDVDSLLDLAREAKVKSFERNLEDKYRDAVGHYRTRRNSKS